jgi:chromate transporter
MHVVFRTLEERHVGPVRLLVPTLASIDVISATLAAAAMLAMFRFKLGLPKTLAASAILGALATSILR